MTSSSFEIFLALFRYYTLIQTESADKMKKKNTENVLKRIWRNLIVTRVLTESLEALPNWLQFVIIAFKKCWAKISQMTVTDLRENDKGITDYLFH